MTSHETLIPLQPLDEYNQQLESNVHPRDWQNPVPSNHYHLVVIGAGTAGLVTAAAAAGLGARVALIERELMGGDCLNVGCVPSKAIIRAARAVAAVRNSNQFGVDSVINGEVDFAAVMQRMRKLRSQISPVDSAKRFSELGVDVYLGQGTFQNDTTISVTGSKGDRELKFKKAVIATGARASAPRIPGLDDVPYLTNETLFSLTELPKRFGVIGGGPIGAEMAQSFARFGSEVSLFEQADRVLAREDTDASTIVQRQFERDGVRLYLNTSDLSVETRGNMIHISGDRQGEAFSVEVDQLLVAVGRAPNVESLGLDTIGVDFDGQGVKVNDLMQTSNKRILAAGDVCSKFKFTHAADFQARAVIQNALFSLGPFGRKKASSLTIPWATYTSPEVAHVGIDPASAAKKGIDIDTYTQTFDHVDRAILDGQEEGFVKVHTRKGTDKILGATIVAEHAGDLISEISLAMTHDIRLSGIGATIHPYPTQADAIRRLGDQYNRTRLTPFSKRLLGFLMRLNVGK